jgi:hypothetical protein
MPPIGDSWFVTRTPNASTIITIHEASVHALKAHQKGRDVPFFACCAEAVMSILALYPVENAAFRAKTWGLVREIGTACADHIAKYWATTPEFEELRSRFRQLSAAEPTPPDVAALTTTLVPRLLDLLECVRLSRTLSDLSQHGREDALNCLNVLCMSSDPILASRAKQLLNELTNNPGGKKGGCFVATAAYGPHDCNVVLLQEYRDRIMVRSFLGRCAVRIYYFLSPPLARFIGTSSRRQTLARKFLRPFIAGARRMLEQRPSRKGSVSE